MPKQHAKNLSKLLDIIHIDSKNNFIYYKHNFDLQKKLMN
jgi:hypothetical protein